MQKQAGWFPHIFCVRMALICVVSLCDGSSAFVWNIPVKLSFGTIPWSFTIGFLLPVALSAGITSSGMQSLCKEETWQQMKDRLFLRR